MLNQYILISRTGVTRSALQAPFSASNSFLIWNRQYEHHFVKENKIVVFSIFHV